MASSGPPTPSTPYTACYCEENVYLLGDALLRMVPAGARLAAVVISNPTASVAIWQQLASRYSAEEDFLVIWDYHVVLCLKLPGEDDVWVYDADTRLGTPCNFQRYARETFKSETILKNPEAVPPSPQYRCMFRVVPINDYLDHFASDRSHMLRISPLTGEEEYAAPPPSYPPIAGPKADRAHNLMSHFVDMTYSGNGYGNVLNDIAFLRDTSWMDVP